MTRERTPITWTDAPRRRRAPSPAGRRLARLRGPLPPSRRSTHPIPSACPKRDRQGLGAAHRRRDEQRLPPAGPLPDRT